MAFLFSLDTQQLIIVAQPRIRELSLIPLRVVVFFVFHTFSKEFYVQGEIYSLRFINIKRNCSVLAVNKRISERFFWI